ncbi:hypothetical protein AB0J47_39915 [Nocardia sp. NPDC049737]|uniref:hypothetical protein n=1 Tax=Nocardia sp. NPDC049737 TaxID=3154358 RepID=UPI00343B933C
MVWITGNTDVLIRTISLLFAVIAAVVLVGAGTTVAMHVLGVSPVWSAAAAGGSVVGTSWVKRMVSGRRARETATAGGDPAEGDADAPAANR